jgi:periplasmic divalent cation tolerance protein
MPQGRRKSGQSVVVFVTASSEEEALRIGRTLVEEGLAACANLLPGIRSIFSWEGKVSEEREVLMLLKTRRDLFRPLAARVKALHTYSVPEIIALPIQEGSAEYLGWICEVTRKPQKLLKKLDKSKKY